MKATDRAGIWVVAAFAWSEINLASTSFPTRPSTYPMDFDRGVAVGYLYTTIERGPR